MKFDNIYQVIDFVKDNARNIRDAHDNGDKVATQIIKVYLMYCDFPEQCAEGILCELLTDWTTSNAN